VHPSISRKNKPLPENIILTWQWYAGVQTLRNSIMAVTLFTVACGYVGARAVPEILLNPDW